VKLRLTEEEKWEAFINRDSTKDDVFFTGVKTTGIYCRPSCRARKPLRKNIEFFETADEAEEKGYRPCKICTPNLRLEESEMTGSTLARQMGEIIEARPEALFDVALFIKHHAISLSQMNRQFKGLYHMTPKAYQDMQRVKMAQRLLEETDLPVLKVALESGFGSLSSFYKQFEKWSQMSPKAYRTSKKKQDDIENEETAFILLEVPSDFKLDECLVYLGRSVLESTHQVNGKKLIKLIRLNQKLFLTSVESVQRPLNRLESGSKHYLKISFLTPVIAPEDRKSLAAYYKAMFDLEKDLTGFYALSDTDTVAKFLIERYRGLRICKMMDLFEGICWSIIGQQINLKFAYTLKKRLVESYGDKRLFGGETHYVFPRPEVISALSVETLRGFQMTQRKSEYILGVAQLFAQTDFESQLNDVAGDYEKLHAMLLDIRGIGNWTADYIILKCFDIDRAFPVADVGIHNALKGILKMEDKPSIESIQTMSTAWNGWEGYMTFYMWRYLYDGK